ncbi:MAG: GNAT family N-acetyltransferase [Actinomycetota bacterium]
MMALDLDLRSYRPEDEPRVLELLGASLGGGPAGERPPEFFRWKHFANPFGSSYMLLAESDGRIAGLRAFMRWRWTAGDRTFSAVRAVDTATHPDFQGKGIFSKLTLRALDDLRAEGVDFVFNTPNPASLAGYLKMGWSIVGQAPIRIRVRRPIRFATRFRGVDKEPGTPPVVHAGASSEVLGQVRGLPELLADAAPPDARLRTPRDATYLGWRYGDAPLLDYRAVAETEGGTLRGLAIFRVRPRGGLWETTLSELIVRPGDRSTARRLLRRVRRSAAVDHLACHFAPGTAADAAVRGSGYMKAPRGMTFVVNPLQDALVPDPHDLGSWALSIGDLEVF